MNTEPIGRALFIGHGYIDNELVVNRIPINDEKELARDFAVSFGGNAVTAAFCCARLGLVPDLLCNSADDWGGRMFAEMVRKYGLHWYERKVRRFSISSIFPNGGKRAMARWRDQDYLHGFPELDLDGYRVVHVDGHQFDAAMHFTQEAQKRKILTSLDGGGNRPRLNDLLQFIDVAIVSLRLCQQWDFTTSYMLEYLRQKGCRVGGVTLGERGMLWYEGSGDVRALPALAVPAERTIDTNGVGDVFHGAYVYSYLAWPDRSWEEHFKFARAAAAHAVQHLGNEASLPTLDDISRAEREFKEAPVARAA